MKPIRPEDLFRAEKERAQTDRNSQHARLLAEAKAAFDKLMAEGQAARKSGRPRKHPLPPLKTSSSRPLVKQPLFAPVPTAKFVPPAPPAPVAVAAVKAPAPVKAAPPASAKHVGKAVVRAVAKRAAPAKKAVKTSSKPGRKAKAASKAKSSKKR